VSNLDIGKQIGGNTEVLYKPKGIQIFKVTDMPWQKTAKHGAMQ
jgi:hypothetical protein